MKKNGQIVLYYFLSKAMFFGFGISFIIGKAKQNSWLAIILGYLLGIILLHFFIKKKMNLLTKSILGKILVLMLSLTILSNTIVDYSVQIINFFLPETPTTIIALSFFCIIIYGANHGFSGFKRLSELLIFVGLPITILGWTGNLPNTELTNFLPFLDGIDNDFIIAILTTTAYSLGPIILLLCNETMVDKKYVYIGYILGCINSLIVIISTIGTLGITLATIYRYPEYIAFKKISAFNIFERMENIFTMVWLMDLILLGILCVISLYNIFKKNWGIFLTFITTCLAMFFLIDIYQNTIFMYQYSVYYILGLIVLMLIATKKESKT